MINQRGYRTNEIKIAFLMYIMTPKGLIISLSLKDLQLIDLQVF